MKRKIILGLIFVVIAIVMYPKAKFYEVSDCTTKRSGEILFDGGTLTVPITTNCCGVEIRVERENATYRIIEERVGDLCRCVCEREVKIFNVSIGAKVLFVDRNGITRVIYVGGFCGWSTYGECKSDEDCVIDGCSGQVCRSKFEEPVFTTCEWFDCYDAKKFNVACKCISGMCQWV